MNIIKNLASKKDGITDPINPMGIRRISNQSTTDHATNDIPELLPKEEYCCNLATD